MVIYKTAGPINLDVTGTFHLNPRLPN